MSLRWNSLPTRYISSPPLLYRFIYTSQSYEFFLTDLTHIWYETLQYKHILEKAEEIGSSIDPSEDANQYDVFMQKIKDALDGAKNTGVIIASGQKPDSIVVTTSTKLPAGLNPLRWTFALSKEPPSAVTQHLLLPLLQSERDHEHREQSLLEHIKEKDNILSKIFDKIDPSQLTSMFPGTAGVRHTKLKTSDLIRHIKGATRFDEKEWQDSAADKNFYAKGFAESVYAQGGLTSLDKARTRDVTWWKQLDNVDDPRSPLSERPEKETKSSSFSDRTASDVQGAADEDMSTEDEDEFQRQETPPHLKKKRDEKAKKPAKDNESNIGTDLDQDAELDDGIDCKKAPNQNPPKKAMGRIGGPKAVPLRRPRKNPVAVETDSDSEPVESKRSQRTSPTQEEANIDDDTKSDSDTERIPKSSPSKHKKDQPTETAPKKKGVLGKIGGKKPEPKRTPTPESPVDNHTEQSASDEDNLQQRHALSKPQASLKKGKKLGIIGGGKKSKAKAPQPEHDDTDEDLDAGPSKSRRRQELQSLSPSTPPAIAGNPSPTPERSKVEPEPELSTEQKANRKREELKRQLDAKSRAPTKKKRRF